MTNHTPIDLWTDLRKAGIEMRLAMGEAVIFEIRNKWPAEKVIALNAAMVAGLHRHETRQL